VNPENRLALIVDDDPDICWALEHVLLGLDVRCTRALNGQSALQTVRLNRFALALLDAKLPDFDGLELAQHIRKAQPGTPIVIISGYFYKDDPTIQAALKQGLIRGFIEKPFSHRDIVDILNGALPVPQAAARKTLLRGA
jgi:CheY-like chemotaxis protein